VTNDFDRVLALSETDQRALLAGPDPQDRLWAMWALALKGGPNVLVEHLPGEPSAGVRRHMCIMLAGGELDLLVAMARFDPDDGVRATASGLVTRLAGGGRLPWTLAEERLADRASRAAVLEELGPGSPPDFVDTAARLARDEDLDVAHAALDALFRMAEAKAIAVIAELLARADERRTYALFTLWSKHAAPAAIHEALRGGAVERRLAAVRHFASQWVDLAPVALDRDVRVRFAVRRAFQQRLGLVPLDVLARWIDDPAEQSWTLAYMVLERLRGGERLPPGTNILARCRRRLAALPPALLSDTDETALALVDDEDRDRYDERACLKTLIAFIEGQN
jgi:hypothetical protein